MRKKKWLMTVAMALCCMTGAMAMPVYAAETTELQLIINDRLYLGSDEQVSAQLIDDRVYVPLRLVGESLDHQVQWLGQSRMACILTDDTASLYPEDAFPAVPEDAPIRVLIDGQVVEIDPDLGEAYMHESGRTMVPVRAVTNNLNCDVDWQDGVVLVTEKPQEVIAPSEERENQVANVTNRNQGVTTDREPQSDSEVSNLEDPSVYYGLTIVGDSIATAEQLTAYLYSKEDHIKSVMAKKYPDYGFIGFPEGIAELYIEIGKKYNIRGDLAFAQAVKETGYFQFYGIVRNGQNNFCGLGATGKLNTGEELQNGVDPERAVYIPGTHGITFGTMADGVEAHIQHLYAYATKDPLPEGVELVDPRFKYVTRGIAPQWTGLNGRWAVPGNGYGESIIGDYWFEALILESN